MYKALEVAFKIMLIMINGDNKMNMKHTDNVRIISQDNFRFTWCNCWFNNIIIILLTDDAIFLLLNAKLAQHTVHYILWKGKLISAPLMNLNPSVIVWFTFQANNCALCQQAIMVLSDGTTSSLSDLFKENNPDKKVDCLMSYYLAIVFWLSIDWCMHV